LLPLELVEMRESLIVVKQPAVRCFQRQIAGHEPGSSDMTLSGLPVDRPPNTDSILSADANTLSASETSAATAGASPPLPSISAVSWLSGFVAGQQRRW
jgi:hypothetical protein